MLRPLSTISLSMFYLAGILFIYNMASGYISIHRAALCMLGLLALYAINMHALLLIDQKTARGEIL